nr:tRNA-dihydrouridine(16/17) synthase [NAD(P)(+)]-like [Ipomoea batatas]
MAAQASADLSHNEDDLLCAENAESEGENFRSSDLGRPHGYLSGEARIERAWAHWKKLGQPKCIVAPMVDNSELPFRMLCRKFGAQAAYTPMLHSRIFTENDKYRSLEFTTCKVPPAYCKAGNYGAFLMDNLSLVRSLVEKLANNLSVPVSCKIRIFPELQDTINYAKMLEEAGCALLAVHGRTRDEKDGKKFRANWDIIKAVKNSVRIPVLANGNIRHMDDVQSCLEETGVEGVLSAESLLENPALFAGYMTTEWMNGSIGIKEDGTVDQAELVVEYLKFCEKYPVLWRMIRSHVHKMLGEWFKLQPDVREDLNKQSTLTFEFLYGLVNQLRERGVRIPLYVKDPNNEGTSTNGIVE